jgi:hypothetical protein
MRALGRRILGAARHWGSQRRLARKPHFAEQGLVTVRKKPETWRKYTLVQ